MVSQTSSGANRGLIIGAIAVYLLICTLIAAIGTVILTLFAGSCGPGKCTTTPPPASETISIFVVGLIVTAIFGIPAWGLFRRKTWSRRFALLPLAVLILPTLLYLVVDLGNLVNGNSIPAIYGTALVWTLLNGVVVYLLLTDEGIKQELSS